MKTLVIFIALLIVWNALSYSQPDQTPSKNNSPVLRQGWVDSVDQDRKTAIKKIDSLKSELIMLTDSLNYVRKSTVYKWESQLLIFLPLLLFIIVSWGISNRLKKQGFILKDALSADIPIPGTNPPIYPSSASRVLLFLSGVASLVISVCLVSYFIYFTITHPEKPTIDMSGLTNVLLSLGIGVIPYAVNKFSACIGINTSQTIVPQSIVAQTTVPQTSEVKTELIKTEIAPK